MIACPSCDISNPDTNVTCHRCGADLSELAATAGSSNAGPSPASGRTFSSPAKVSYKKFGYPPSGVLILSGGRFGFITPQGVEFDVPVEEVTDINTPGMMLGAGFTCMIEGRKYTVNFVKVNMSAYSAAMRSARLAGGALAALGAGVGLIGAARTLADIGNARDLTRTWIEVLTTPPGEADRPIFSDASSSSEIFQNPAAAPAGERSCPKCGTSFSRLSVQCPKCGAIAP